MSIDSCVVCGGDGQLSNSFGSNARCPACHGTGRRSEDLGFHDVTKTKPSHHRQPVTAAKAEKAQGPATFEGRQLADAVKACPTISNDTKVRLEREIVEYEASHGACTQTFSKKVKKQLRPPTG
jgi:RecJ-like exonuclease